MINTAVSGSATISLSSFILQVPDILNAIVPNTESHTIVKTVGTITTPIINSRIVLPFDIRAMNIPTKGVQAINHAK